MFSAQVDWSRYARDYDFMGQYNPAYQQLIEEFLGIIAHWGISDRELLVDLGAGTGNFPTVLAEHFPACRVIHVDANAAMNGVAIKKARERDLSNLDVHLQDVTECNYAAESIAAVVSVHSLYAMPNPVRIVKRMCGWLRPGANAFFCDTGRSLPIRFWTPSGLPV